MDRLDFAGMAHWCRNSGTAMATYACYYKYQPPWIDDVHQASKASHGKRKGKRNVRVKSNATRDLDGVQRHAALETHRDRVKCRVSRLQIL
jgi:hypothetical protein